MKELRISSKTPGEEIAPAFYMFEMCFEAVLLSWFLERCLALFPVAWAEFVGLKAIENAEYLWYASANAKVVDAHPADDVVRVNDKGRTKAHAGVFVKNSKRFREFALCVREHRERQILEFRVIVAPGKVHVVCVRAAAKNHRIPVFEVVVLAAELRNFRRADKREIHGPEEKYLPLSFVVLVGDGFELFASLTGNGSLNGEFGEFVANGDHGWVFFLTSLTCCWCAQNSAEIVMGTKMVPLEPY